MKSFVITIVLFTQISLPPPCHGQARQPGGRGVPPQIRGLLERIGVRVREPARVDRGSQELHIHWEAEADPTAGPTRGRRQRPSPGAFAVTRRTQREESVPLHRAPELSSSQMLVVAVDEQQVLVGWNLIADPQILRAETADAIGNLSGEILYRSQADFLVPLPVDPAIKQLRFYHPARTGGAFTLELLGTVVPGSSNPIR